MGDLLVNSNHQVLAERAKALTVTVNQLIADIESDLASPAEAAFHAKDTYAALKCAHLAFLDAIAQGTRGHYEGTAVEARAA